MNRIKSWFDGSWSEEKQRWWAWGFIIGFIMTNVGYGLGWIIVQAIK